MAAMAFTIRLELRDIDRVKLLIWELRQLEHRLRIAASPEADVLGHAIDRFLADLGVDEPEGPPA